MIARQAEVNGTRLYYEMAGSGEPLVLLHGFSLDTRLWDEQFDAFAQHYRTIRYDARGFGRSSLPDGPYRHIDDLRALLLTLEAAPAHLLGLSLGGGVMLDFALAYPDDVRSLILADTALGGYAWAKDWGEPRRAARAEGLAAAKAAWLNDELFAAANEQPALAARLQQMVSDYSGYHWLQRDSERGPEVPAIKRLEAIDVPTLIIVGERDLPEFCAIADQLAARLPHARMVELKGVGHMSNMEAPAAFNDAVLAFLALLDR